MFTLPSSAGTTYTLYSVRSSRPVRVMSTCVVAVVTATVPFFKTTTDRYELAWPATSSAVGGSSDFSTTKYATDPTSSSDTASANPTVVSDETLGYVLSNEGGVPSAVVSAKVNTADWTLSICDPPFAPLSSRANTYTS